MLSYGQCVKQDIVLRTESKVFANIHHVSPQIKSINVGSSWTWWHETCSAKRNYIWNEKSIEIKASQKLFT